MFHHPDGEPDKFEIHINLRSLLATFLLVAFVVCVLGAAGAWR